MPEHSVPNGSETTRSKFHYGWVIIAVCTLMMAITYGLMYTYSVFFKPLAEYFDWDRATVSAIYSVSLVIRGAVSIGVGWLADRYGAVKLSVFCSLMIGLGLILTSQVTALWQFFLTYALIEAIGLSGTFGIATAVTSRWFTKNRGLALGIVSSGVGIGTLFIVPGAERLINAFDWSAAYIIFGIASGVIMIGLSFFLRPAPQPASPRNNPAGREKTTPVSAGQPDINYYRADSTLGEAVRSPQTRILLAIFALFFFSTHMVIVHLVNYATDIGITPLVAATLVSIVGIFSIAGRLTMGVAADKVGIHNTLMLCCVLLTVSIVVLIFTRSLWAFYLFAIIFGFAYGGEVPQIPLLAGKHFGTKSLAALVGLILFVGNIGGALGPWVAGKIFDVTAGYQWAFIIGSIAALGSLVTAYVLKKHSRVTD